MLDLPLHDFVHRCGIDAARSRAKQMQRGAQGRERVPQLVRQHRDELVLALLDVTVLRHVARGAGDGFHLPVGPHHRDQDVVVDPASEGAGEGHLAAHRLAGGDHLLDLAVVHRRVPRLVAELQAVLADRFVPGLAPHPEQPLVRVDEAVIEVPDVGEVRRVAEDRLVQPALPVGVGAHLRERRLGLLAARGIARGAEPFHDLAALVEERNGTRQGPAQRSVGPQHPVLELEHPLGAHRVRDGLEHARLVVGMDVFVQPSAARLGRIGDEIAPGEMAHLAPVGAHAVDHVGGCGDEGAEALVEPIP